ncbi:glycosyltransferase family 39 protein [Streptomyces sp. NBC_01619]|uniref:glycosyltransferase family 39 protein n=1 Tax=Streptomyces sp. NBC_01619 TaxID=2975901 RepID=UPI00224ED167|nr:glycosyltransferase family 39 protein [Streptomyces sp. NBC_01619]
MALAAAAFRINGPQLVTDELVTWDVASRSFGDILATLHNVDAVHGAYYMLMHGWMMLFGDSVVALRLPSTLSMAGTAALVALIGRRLFGQRAAMCGGLLFALIPAVSRFGQEARSYGLAVLVATLATFLLLRALDKPRSWGRWTGYSFCLVFLGLLHLVALTILLGHVVATVLMARRERRALRGFCLAMLGGLVLLVPLVLAGRSQVSRQLWYVPRPDLWGLVDIWPKLFASSMCAGALIALALVAAKERRQALPLCAALAVLPPLVVWVASQGDISYFRFQYLLITLPAWAVLAGAGLASATTSWTGVTAALAVIAVLGLSDQTKLRGEFAHHDDVPTDYVGAGETIMKYYRPGDAVIYNRNGPAWMLDQGVRYYLPRDVTLREVFLAASADEQSDLFPLYCPEPARCLNREARIWLVVPGNTWDSLGTLPPNQAQVLRAQYDNYGSERHPGVTVSLLTLKPPK